MINSKFKVAQKIVNLGQIGIGIGIIVIVVLLILLNLKEIYKCIKNVGVSFIASGAFLIVGHFLLSYNIKVMNLRILNNSISMVMQNIILEIFDKISRVGLVLGVLGFVLIILGNILKKEK